MFVHARRIVFPAYKRHQAVVAFNTINAETTLAIARAASSLRVPALFEISEKTINYLGLETVVALTRAVASDKSVKAPLAIHLDHGHSFEICRAAIQAGFSSVMIDASALPFSANVKLTRKVVDYAHKRGVLVQGELGALKPTSGKRLRAAKDFMTDPAQAHEFVRLTGVDTLGVAVGTLHGPMKILHKLPKIDFARLACIHDLVRVPLVLHGASGVAAPDLRRARSLGVGIVNIDTDLRMAYLKSLRRELKAQPREYDPRTIFSPVVAAVQRAAEQKLRALQGYLW
jgi:fructose-bisphosphate aldolase class II